jgi:hypothetical protein
LKYIGKTVNPTKRYSSHLNEIKKDKKSTWVQSLKNNGKNPDFLILDICEENEWIFLEQWYIAYFKFLGAELKNSTNGGDLEPLSKNNFKGKFHTIETKERISSKLSGINNPMYGTISPFKGKTHSTETKKLISEKISGLENPNSKRVGKYDKDGNLLETFATLTIATKVMGYKSKQSLAEACINNLERKGFFWKYL